jgi:putative protease
VIASALEENAVPRPGGPRPLGRVAFPELLAPAGDWDCARAAVENGADAIYFGLARFNARMRAANFTEADLPHLMEFLHRRGVRGYVTFNTLVFADELAEAERSLRAIIAAGVDAAIVQDVGICRLIRRLSPDFPIHASTQMSITSAAGVEFARQLGCQLVVLARELSLQDIEALQRESAAGPPALTKASPALPADASPASRLAPYPAALPLEVFVHGALCVAYSGQCLTSEALGGRSANRGECAQACRMPYELIADGQRVELGDRRYLLSPQDLAGIEVLPDLLRLGVASLKIEGRLKSPEYVANVTRVYRQALDNLQRAAAEALTVNTGWGPAARPTEPPAATPDQRYALEMAFSRGLFTGWLRGVDHQRLVHARFGKKRGVYLGEVTRVGRDTVSVRLCAPLKPGDGVVFDAGQPEAPEQGGRVYEIRVAETESGANRRTTHGPRANGRQPRPATAETEAAAQQACEVVLRFGRGDVDLRRVHVGDRLWKTSDPDLERRLRRSYAGVQPHWRRPIQLTLRGRAGAPLVVTASDELGHTVQVESAQPLLPAERSPLTTDRLREHLGRLGGTPFQLATLENFLDGALILPLSELNRLRRQIVAALELRRAQPPRWTLLAPDRPPTAPSHPASPTGSPTEDLAELVVLVRDLDQLEAAIQSGVRTLYCEFEDLKKYRLAVARFRECRRRLVAADGLRLGAPDAADRPAPGEIFVAPPRIFKPGETWMLEQVRSCQADGYLVRNYDHLSFFAEGRRIGDFSLNVANPLAAEYFLQRYGLERVTASYDLNAAQLEALLQTAPPAWFEITLHQHMPMFHMEHCVFCAFLSRGKDYRDCGRPCDRHQVKLRDRVGAEHPVKADAGCRNTVFNALAQTGAEHVARLQALGARRFRLEFLNEPPEQVRHTIAKYRQLLRGEITGTQLWRELKLLNQLGVTRGAMTSP